MEYLIKDFWARINEMEEQVEKLEKELKHKTLTKEEQIVVNKKIKEKKLIKERALKIIADLRDEILNEILN